MARGERGDLHSLLSSLFRLGRFYQTLKPTFIRVRYLAIIFYSSDLLTPGIFLDRVAPITLFLADSIQCHAF